MSQFFASGGQSIGASASASVLPMNMQDWFPLGWIGWISLQSKGLSRVLSHTTIQKHQFFIGNELWAWEDLRVLGQQDQTSQSPKKSTLSIHWKDWCWSWSSDTLATWCKEPAHWKRPDAGKDWGQNEKEATKKELVGWFHWLNGHEFDQTLGDSEGQGSQACCRLWGCRELDKT